METSFWGSFLSSSLHEAKLTHASTVKSANARNFNLFILIDLLCSSILGGTVMIGYEKGVRIVSCLILKPGLRITFSTDKTIAPHRICYIICQLRQGISNRYRCYCQPYLRGNSNLRSLTLEDKISITPFVIMSDSPSANSLARW